MKKLKLAHYKHEWYLKNRERMLELSRKRNFEHKEEIKKYIKRYHEEHKEKVRLHKLKYYLNNDKKVKDRATKWRKDNPEYVTSYNRKYAKTDKRKIWVNTWRKRKYKTDSEWKKRKLYLNRKYFNKADFNGHYFECLERDDYTCQKCFAKNNLHVHHLRYGDDLKLEDLITWCVSCHMSYHAKERRKQIRVLNMTI